MNWNYSNTKKKLTKKRSPYYSIYEDRYSMGNYTERMKKEKRIGKIAWITGYIVITLLTSVFVCCLVWLV
jgi:purine-cytosine permease-like protein